MQINEREREFKEVSREREIQLRKQGVLDRARQAAQLRAMDVKVDTLRRALVVITLELQMLFVFATLEEEASEVSGWGTTTATPTTYNHSASPPKQQPAIVAAISTYNKQSTPTRATVTKCIPQSNTQSLKLLDLHQGARLMSQSIYAPSVCEGHVPR